MAQRKHNLYGLGKQNRVRRIASRTGRGIIPDTTLDYEWY
jgi:hypothetical protein